MYLEWKIIVDGFWVNSKIAKVEFRPFLFLKLLVEESKKATLTVSTYGGPIPIHFDLLIQCVWKCVRACLFAMVLPGGIVPTWAAFWPYRLVRPMGPGPSPPTPLPPVGTRTPPTGTAPRAGRGEMAACPTLAASTPCTGAARVYATTADHSSHHHESPNALLIRASNVLQGCIDTHLFNRTHLHNRLWGTDYN